jgi:hypothetical protein
LGSFAPSGTAGGSRAELSTDMGPDSIAGDAVEDNSGFSVWTGSGLEMEVVVARIGEPGVLDWGTGVDARWEARVRVT